MTPVCQHVNLKNSKIAVKYLQNIYSLHKNVVAMNGQNEFESWKKHVKFS